MRYETIIFDFNGTLLDDCDCCLKILNELTKKYHLHTVSKEEYLDIFTFPVSEYYQKIGFDISNDKFVEIGNQFHERYDKYSPKEAKIFESAERILSYLHHKVRLVCLSASKQETLFNQLKYYQIDQYFTHIIGISDKLARSKLAAGISFMKENQIDPKKTIMIGDSIHDMEVAKALQIQIVLISTGHTAKKRLCATHVQVIDDLLQLLPILE